ncbi:MAG TPA: ATP-binding protein [Verrucomicrobiae bacterium]|jgi:nitrogen-specific signal transduction histidine kinase/CheY-like chemotaxis protein|nr:ATP-binding protein [Verrucomicrobiae bacterium]
MRPETDFVLEKAAWPALLLEESGLICRANQAARDFLSLGGRDSRNLAAFLRNGEAADLPGFLARQAEAGSGRIKLRLGENHDEEFVSHVTRVQRDHSNYFVVQLFKEGAAAVSVPVAPAPKPIAPPPPPAPTPVAPPPPALAVPAAPPSNAADSSTAHKQKLDCALQLARSVALDFNNALTSILGHASLLLSKTEPNHPWRNSLGEIEKSAAKAAEIANDLAAFSRQEKDTRTQMSGNVNSLLERTIELFQNSRPTAITITRQLERKLFTANFDEAKMQQAVVKIFENAVESIPERGSITVQTRNIELTEPMQDRTAKLNAGNYVCLEISDDGAGIAEEVMPRIFEPFFTTKGARHRGLGLAWVYGIVTNHGGGVAISSKAGAGTAVRVYLPANRKLIRESMAEYGDLNGTETVLMVDDEDLLLTMGQMVLSSFGYTVITANSGQKALELFAKSKNKIDLVITDLVMPIMSGRELTEQILKLAPETRVLWCSGYVRSASNPEEERYLQKPFTSQDLLRKVKQALHE